MRIENPMLLAEFRLPGFCAWCKKLCRVREGAHLWGGSTKLDIRINLIALGSTPNFCCQCHTNSHQKGGPSRGQLLHRVAMREKESPDDITAVIVLLKRIPPRIGESKLEAFYKELTAPQMLLLRRTLEESKWRAE